MVGPIDAVPALRAAREAGAANLLDAVAAVLTGPVLGLLLWPLRVLVRPLAATAPAAWLAAMGPALLVLAAHYLWVIRSDTAFEETAAEASLAQARRRSARGASGATAVRRGGPISAPLVALQPTGWPAWAIFWKNVTAVLRRRRAGRFALGFVVASGLAAAGSFGAQRGIAEFAAVLAITWFGFVFALGPQWIRNDLRSDLLQVDLLRAYPVPGWAIVLVETLASTLVLTALELAMLVFVYCALLGNTGFEVPPDERALLLAAAFVLLPPITFSAMLLQNGAALLYPAWVRLGMAQRGVEALGQNLLATAAFALILAVLFAGPGLAGWLVYTGLAPDAGDWALAPALLIGFVLLAAELILLIRWLGRAFERTDAASVPVTS
jgi:ABC-2 type transport system permease protein